ncbi:prolyl 4-hydroxylase subunit alpha-1-like isoform X2 [Haemaphysalis longicornis]
MDAKTYEKLCSSNRTGLERRSPTDRLRCIILHINGDAMLRWRPLHVEVLSEEPRIALVHNFLTGSEQRVLKQLAEPLLERATVYEANKTMVPSKTRISKVSWLEDEEHPLLARVSAAVSAVTGMDVACAEDLQVVNYGVGGLYTPHPDYSSPEEPDGTRDSVTGQRAATWLMYLSDVRRGGSTVFPELGLQSTEKEAALGLAEYLKREQERLQFCGEMLDYMRALDPGLRLDGPDDDDDDHDDDYDIDDDHPAGKERPLTAYLRTTWLAKNFPELVSDQVYATVANRQPLVLPEGSGASTRLWPTDEDLAGSAIGVCRLQHTYGLSAKQMVELRSPLLNVTAHDRREVARRCCDGDDLGNAIGWWTSSLDALEEEGDDPTDDWKAILDAMSRITLRVQNKKAAFRLLSALHDGASTHVRDQLVEAVLADERMKYSEVALDTEQFEQLCSSNRTRIEGRASARLHCTILRITGDAMLRWRPLHVEVLSEEPRIALVHNFLTGREQRVLKQLAEPLLFRAVVYAPDNTQTTAKIRISKVAWLKDEHHPMVARLSAAVSAVTGMDVACAEETQVVNYGVGGHYSPHHDYSPPYQRAGHMDSVLGQRAATWLMYLSDVKRGGSTIFPKLGLEVEAKAGRALFWINLLPEQKHGFHFEHRFKYGQLSEGDNRTKHGACPVLLGSKWIATKWIHELGQTRIPFDWPGGGR